MRKSEDRINEIFNIYRMKDEYYPLFLVSKTEDLFKKVIEINHENSEQGTDIVVSKEVEIKKQCFVLPEYVKIQAENINDGSIVTHISALIQTSFKEKDKL